MVAAGLMSPNEQLERAVNGGDLAAVEALIARHPDLLNSRSGLWKAAANGCLEIVEWLWGIFL